MAFQIHNDSIQTSVKKVAIEQIDKAIADVRNNNLDIHEKVHNSRVRCKNIRGLLRLIRTSIRPSYQAENIFFRDCARLLSDIRDSQSMIEIFDKIMIQFKHQINSKDFNHIHRHLLDHQSKIIQNNEGIKSSLNAFLKQMLYAHSLVDEWKIEGSGFHCIKGGLKKTYADGKKAMHNAYSHHHSSRDNFHEWRKSTKYHSHHLKLLRPLWIKPMEARLSEVENLSSLLGDEHDLTIFSNLLHNLSEELKNKELEVLIDLIYQQKNHLHEKARVLGLNIYAESPKHFSRRISTYWSNWEKSNRKNN